MHPDRLNFLAYNNAPSRAVVSREFAATGWSFRLECGHESSMPPHFDGSKTASCRCFSCGETLVRSSPRYADEFAAA